jgi:hypothetical protein
MPLRRTDAVVRADEVRLHEIVEAAPAAANAASTAARVDACY